MKPNSKNVAATTSTNTNTKISVDRMELVVNRKVVDSKLPRTIYVDPHEKDRAVYYDDLFLNKNGEDNQQEGEA